MKLSFDGTLIAADSETRTLTGQIVPFGKPGNTSAGPVVFEQGAFLGLSEGIKLNLEHDRTKPLGYATEIKPTPAGITAKFQLVNTQRASDVLVEASEGLRTGFSIEASVEKYDVRKGVMYVSSATLEQVAVVTSPAFGENAQIYEVTASEGEAVETNEENEAIVTETTENVVEAAETVVEAAAAEPVKASAPVYASVRQPSWTPSLYLEKSVRAAMGDHDAQMLVKAASDGTSTEWAGLVPTPQLATIINGKTTSVRPTIAAVSTAALPAAGLTFEIPRVKTAPTVAAGVAEKGAFSDTQGEIEYLSVSVKKAAGMQKFDVEVLDRTSPAFFDELVRLMADGYAKATDDAMHDALVAGGTADTTAITLPWDGDELAGFISRAAASIYGATLRFPTGIVVTPTQWANMVGLNDGNKRPLFNVAGSPSNPAGSLDVTQAAGNILGLPVYVTPHTGLAAEDGSMIVLNREAYTFYESAAPLQLRTNIVATGQIEVGYYGYYAIAPKIAAGAFKFNNAA